MSETLFPLAPPAKTVDGLLAVPIDIQRIMAGLTFDGAAMTAYGDATLDFVMGTQDGNPIFDLRQTISAVWLDGAAMPAGRLAHHDFGGGSGAELRIVEAILTAGSTHTLRITYNLGLPQASGAGTYQPSLTWNPGPRLIFSFGFTDLGAGRYLEAWIPANLIFDQFELSLEITLLNFALPHTVITNGDLTSLDSNHWSIAFPKRFTALSPLLEVRAADTLENLTDTTTLPHSAATVTIEAWKLLGDTAVSLTAEVNRLKTWLAENETAVGPYMHGGRFTAFLSRGAMEYEGGTTSLPTYLRHESFHSWWGRGVKPASQPDAWWDEAWTVYTINGAAGTVPFNFGAPPVELCPRNPWVRITTGSSYSSGNAFWEGVAALIGAPNLNSLMSDFYRNNNARPATTTEIEEFLVCRTGNPDLVDAFHRFVYGFQDPAPVPDLWLKDAPPQEGGDFWMGRFWDSPDLWIRNANDGGTDHQPPEYGQDNWFYARVRNRSISAAARHWLIAFNVKPFAGTQFFYPDDFLPCVAAASGFDLGPGAFTVVKARWPAALVPPEGTHTCWLAAVLTRSENPVAGRHVWEQNNLAQKNLTVVDLVQGDWVIVPFVVSNVERIPRRFSLEIVRPEKWSALQASLIHDYDKRFGPVSHATRKAESAILDCGGRVESFPTRTEKLRRMITSKHPEGLDLWLEKSTMIPFPRAQSAFIPLSMPAQSQNVFGLRLCVPAKTKPGERIRIDLIKRFSVGKKNIILGGISVEMNVRADK